MSGVLEYIDSAADYREISAASRLGPNALQLFEFWSSHGRSGAAPWRDHFDPIKIAAFNSRLLPHLWLIEVERESLRFRFRLIGGALKEAGALANAGNYIDEFPGFEKAQRLHRGCMELKKPIFRRGPPYLPHDAEVCEIEIILLPLFDEQERVSHQICCTTHDWQYARVEVSA